MGKVGDFFVSLGLRTKGFDGESAKAVSEIKKIDSAADISKAKTASLESENKKLSASFFSVAGSVSRAAGSIRALTPFLGDIEDRLRRIGRRARAAASGLDKLGGSAKVFRSIGSSASSASKSVDSAESSFRKMTVSAGGLSGVVGKLGAGLGILGALTGAAFGITKLTSLFTEAAPKAEEFNKSLQGIAKTMSDFTGDQLDQFQNISDKQRDINEAQRQFRDLSQQINDKTAEEEKRFESLLKRGFQRVTTGRTINDLQDENNKAQQELTKQLRNQLDVIEKKHRLIAEQAVADKQAIRDAQEVARIRQNAADFEKTTKALIEEASNFELSEQERIEKSARESSQRLWHFRNQLRDAETKEWLDTEEIRRKVEAANDAIYAKRRRELDELEGRMAEKRKKEAEELIKMKVEAAQKLIDKEKELQDLQNRQVGQFGAIQVGAGGAVFSDQSLLHGLTFNGMGGAP